MNAKARVVIEYMKNNLHQSLTVHHLAQRAGLSRSRLSHLFACELGMPPARFLKLLKLQKSSVLLETSLLSVKEISAKVGYQYGHHFMRDFRKAYGMTPSEYRAHHAIVATSAEHAATRIDSSGDQHPDQA